jgi:hypothetical protein
MGEGKREVYKELTTFSQKLVVSRVEGIFTILEARINN